METMGQKFRAARERKRINVSRAAALTRIKLQHLEAMENDDFSQMPAPTYAKGFIRIYADFLGLDSAPLVQEYMERHLQAPEKPGRTRASGKPKPAIPDDRSREPGPERKKSPWDAGAFFRRVAGLVTGHLPQWGSMLLLVFVAVAIVRCASGIGSVSSESTPASGRLDESAIMKVAPPRYLELPESEPAP